MSEKKLVPKLRFEKFKDSEAWTSYNLGKEAQILTGGTPSTKIEAYWYPKEIPWMSSGEINKKRVFETNTYISNIGFENSSATWVKAKSILIALAGQGKTRGTVAINEIPLTTNQSIAAIIPFENKLQSEYLFHNLDNRYEEMRLVSSGDGTRGGLNKEIISDLEIIAPNTLEQKKIGDFFKKIDKMIQLQQSKVNKVKDIKSAYLSEMFPKEGEKYPKRRFEGFTEPWKTIKMREVFSTVLSGNRLPKTSLKGGNIPYVLATTENNGVYARIDKETRDYHGNKMKIFNTPSISFSIDNPEAIFLQEENYFTSNIMRVLINNDLEKEEYIFFVETLRKATGGFNWGVKFSGPVVLDLDINVPFNKMEDKIDNQEIKKIGLFINELDEAEKLEKSKLEKLEKLKQAYLNDMFV